VLEVAGILGTAPNSATAKGLREGLKRYPNIKIIGTVAGNWTEPVAQSAVLQWLSTHPGGVQGVATQSPGEEGTLAAYLQSGRKPPPFTLGGVLGPAAYWQAHKDWADIGYNVWPPGDEGQAGFEALIRILQGQGALIQSILYPPSSFTYKDLPKVMPAHTATTSSDWVSPKYGKAFPYTAAVMNKYWKNGIDPLKWKHH
jgi:ribose transport system substrate-binding protein